MISDMAYVMYTPAFTVDQCGVCNVLNKVQNGAAWSISYPAQCGNASENVMYSPTRKRTLFLFR